MKPDTKYIVGHYIQYYVSRDFHKDFEHDDLDSAMSSWRHLCAELPDETEVEIHKQTTEVVVARRNVPEADEDLERWRVFDQS